MSVAAPFFVPGTVTLTPISGSPEESLTVPDIPICCADKESVAITKSTRDKILNGFKFSIFRDISLFCDSRIAKLYH